MTTKRHEERARTVAHACFDAHFDGWFVPGQEVIDLIASALASVEQELVREIRAVIANSHVAAHPLQVIDEFCTERGIAMPKTEDVT